MGFSENWEVNMVVTGLSPEVNVVVVGLFGGFLHESQIR
jgi:hypothetical protein